MGRLMYTEEMSWKGIDYVIELHETDNPENLSPITQTQAVPFVDDKHVVIYKHIDGYYGLPGGTVEEGESFETALKREVFEESTCEIIDFGLIGYQKTIPVKSPADTKYQLRYWASVKLLDQPVKDPDGKALDREVVTIEEAIMKLNWGPERGRILLGLALKKYKQKYGLD